MAMVVMAMMMMVAMMMVVVMVPDHAAHLVEVEAVLDEMANDPRAVMMMERLAGSRSADDESERGRRRKQGFLEHDDLRLGDVGRWLKGPWRPCPQSLRVRAVTRCD